ncbi:hypothetical protein HBI56_124330 [Parastagonospora nodorum]|nr:hypothetical protein HBI06_158460 [Parastagonospora nodorum]KAH4248862.1 hypothetical protein HBI05_025160 [Parastagonospora nodorum]KAH5153271.1 hypothetical protein HBH69_128130 [Parastagonospora nodorum]KAH5769161.1 hypothetical protein HBI17_026290 [Parastagonospora nodorum]KAH6051462.1 hypothetical protein HBI54_035250 [Parastagonospora nodorum]
MPGTLHASPHPDRTHIYWHLYEWLNANIPKETHVYMMPPRMIVFCRSMLPDTNKSYLPKALFVGAVNVNKRFEHVYAYRTHEGRIVFFRDCTLLELEFFDDISWNKPFTHVQQWGGDHLRKIKALCSYYYATSKQTDRFVEIGGISRAKLKEGILMICREFQGIERKKLRARMHSRAAQNDGEPTPSVVGRTQLTQGRHPRCCGHA